MGVEAVDVANVPAEEVVMKSGTKSRVGFGLGSSRVWVTIFEFLLGNYTIGLPLGFQVFQFFIL